MDKELKQNFEAINNKFDFLTQKIDSGFAELEFKMEEGFASLRQKIGSVKDILYFYFLYY